MEEKGRTNSAFVLKKKKKRKKKEKKNWLFEQRALNSGMRLHALVGDESVHTAVVVTRFIIFGVSKSCWSLSNMSEYVQSPSAIQQQL